VSYLSVQCLGRENETMLANLTQKARGIWRDVNDEPDTARRWVLRMALSIACITLVVLVLWLLTQPETPQIAIVLKTVDVLLSAAIIVYPCWCVTIMVRRSQHRLESQGRPAGALRAAMWAFVKGDASIKLASLLTLLLLAELCLGASPLARSFTVYGIIGYLLTVGALPGDRFLLGAAPQPSTERKIAWVFVGLFCGAFLMNGFFKLQRCGCSLSEAAPLITEPLFVCAYCAAVCQVIQSFNDPLAKRRLRYRRR